MPNTWLIYIRKSVVKDDTDLESPERQLFVCKTRLSLLDGDIKTEIYEDLDRSGSNEAGRPAWLDLKSQLNRPDVAGIITSSLDRLYRNVREFLESLDYLEKSGKALITAKENLDTTSHLGRFVVTILMALFEMEWRLSSNRMTEMVAYKRREQGRHWGPTPFGCERNDDGQLVASTATDPGGHHLYDALTEIFKLFSAGNHSYDSLADAVNDAGWQYQDRFGVWKPFTKETIREILARWRLYRGDLPLGNPRKNANVEWLDGGHQPILPVELCDAVGHQLAARNRPYKARQTNRIYLLTGILHCHECGDKLSGQPRYNTYYYRHSKIGQPCSQRYYQNAIGLERQLIAALIEVIKHPTLLADIRRGLKSLQPATIQPSVEQIKTLRSRLDRLEDIYINGDISRNSYLTKRGRILSDLAELEMKQQQPGNITGLLDDITSAIHLIANASPGTQRELIATLFLHVTAADGKIKTATPNPWALPFFMECQKWAGRDFSPHGT